MHAHQYIHLSHNYYAYPHVTTLHDTANPVTRHQLDELKLFIQSCKSLTVITGAGISTESGISDYRSPGRFLNRMYIYKTPCITYTY